MLCTGRKGTVQTQEIHFRSHILYLRTEYFCIICNQILTLYIFAKYSNLLIFIIRQPIISVKCIILTYQFSIPKAQR